MPDAAAQLETLRRRRERPEHDLSIAGMVRSVAASASRTHRQLGDVIDLWHEIIPGDLCARSRVTALRGGVLHVEVDSASVRFTLDRHLRSGATAELRRRFRGTLASVRLAVGRAGGGGAAPG